MAQKNGIVFLECLATNNSNSSSSSSSSGDDGGGSTDDNDNNNYDQAAVIKEWQEATKGLPVNFSAVHLCVPNELKYKLAVAVFLVVLGKEIRSQLRIHSESSIIETMYSLQNFGISDFPLTHTGTIKAKHMKDFIKARTAIDKFRQERCKQKIIGTGVL